MNGRQAGVALVAAIMLFVATPIIYTAAGNGLFRKPPKPELVLPVGGDGKCVEVTDYMRANHMKLLVHARDRIVRGGELLPKYHIEGCKNCHNKRAEFCDRCHSYAGVKPECFECHYLP
jgi:hypothetical protein